MQLMPSRRFVITTAGGALAASAVGWPPLARAQAQLKLGPAEPFSFAGLIQEAESRAARPFAPAAPLAPDVIARIDYDALAQIKFDPGHALFREGPGAFPVTFFCLGQFFAKPVHMYVLSASNATATAREILYDPAYFSMPANSPAHELPADAGFAGFRFQESRLADQHKLPWRNNDWVAFLGASYFRAIGELYQYGLSARGIAIDVAVAGRTEEFPDFTRFYFEPQAGDGQSVTVYALLEGPSIVGAYRFVMHRQQAVLMEVEAHLCLRRDIAQLGIAPMTSMYWFSETGKPQAIDWRPEVHDSDGLALWTGAGEHIWRPLNDPNMVVSSAFADRTPRGFGLLQRDRNFDHYLDGVHYERRPSLWVEPLEDWGEGVVQLVELPTDDEIHDNIVAMWVAKEPARAGAKIVRRDRLNWAADEPHPTTLARCVATRLGRGGQPGHPRPPGVYDFVVEFQGGVLATLPAGVLPKAMLWAPSGTFSYVSTEAVPDGVLGHWRAQFNFTPASAERVDIRLFLKLGERTLSETWLYQFQPPPK
jgi:periplasmic glucans biosynthesis protein